VKAIVTYESVYGNTRQVAEGIAQGLGRSAEVKVVGLHELDDAEAAAADLLVVGGPTHMHGLSTSASRKMAVQAAEEEDVEVEPGAAEGPGLRGWLKGISGDGKAAAAFDTRLDRSPTVTGVAARGIARRLRRRGFELLGDHESFLVEDSEGPLVDGELERARAWGAALGERL
jgi:hypothetical protein